MGQPITVTMRAGTRPEIRFFEANRSITGMAIETYTSADEATGDRPPDVLARRLFDLGATKVTVYSNVVTVEAPASAWPELEPKARSRSSTSSSSTATTQVGRSQPGAWKRPFQRSSNSQVTLVADGSRGLHGRRPNENRHLTGSIVRGDRCSSSSCW